MSTYLSARANRSDSVIQEPTPRFYNSELYLFSWLILFYSLDQMKVKDFV